MSQDITGVCAGKSGWETWGGPPTQPWYLCSSLFQSWYGDCISSSFNFRESRNKIDPKHWFQSLWLRSAVVPTFCWKGKQNSVSGHFKRFRELRTKNVYKGSWPNVGLVCWISKEGFSFLIKLLILLQT